MARVKFPTAIATVDDLRQDRTYMLEEIAAIEAALGINLSNCGGGGSTPRLDQVLDPTADKTFNMGGYFLEFDFPIVGGHGGLTLYSTFAGAFPYGGATPLTIHTNITGSADHCIAVGMDLYGDGNGTGSRAGSYIYGILIENLSWTAGPVEADSAAIRIKDQDGMATVGHEFALLIDDQSDSGAWAIKTGLGLVELGDALEVHGNLGFFATTPTTKQTVSGAKLPVDDVMASLLAALAAYGLITDSTT